MFWFLLLVLLGVPGLLTWAALARVFWLVKFKEVWETYWQFQRPSPKFFQSLLMFTLKSGRLTQEQLASKYEVELHMIRLWAFGGRIPSMGLRRRICRDLRREWGRDPRVNTKSSYR